MLQPMEDLYVREGGTSDSLQEAMYSTHPAFHSAIRPCCCGLVVYRYSTSTWEME